MSPWDICRWPGCALDIATTSQGLNDELALFDFGTELEMYRVFIGGGARLRCGRIAQFAAEDDMLNMGRCDGDLFHALDEE